MGESFGGAPVENGDGLSRRERRPEVILSKGGHVEARTINTPREDRKHKKRQWGETPEKPPQIEN